MGVSSYPGLNPIIGTPNPDTFLLGFLVTYNGSGVPAVAQGRGIKAIVDDGTGLFTITTARPWKALIGAGHMGLAATAAGFDAEVVATTSSTKTVQIRLTDAAGAAADPANGFGMYFNLLFQEANLPTTG